VNVPIRIRLALASCAVFVVVIAALEVIAYVSVRSAIHSIVDHELETRFAGVADHLARHIGRIPWPQLSESLKLHPAFQPELLRIRDAKGAVLLEGAELRGIAEARSSPMVSIRSMGSVDRTLRVLTVSRPIDGAVYDLTLATDLYFPARILGRLWLLMLLSLPLVLLIAGGAGYWISGKAMRPVSDIISAARAVDSSRLSQRIAVPQTGDEIGQLAETMNGMLARIEASFQQVRQFIANASHELRTPIAIIRANAEIALLEGERSGRASREALRRILKEAERDSVLLEDMLELARIDSGALLDHSRWQPVDLNTSLTLACSDVRPLAESRSLTLRCSPAPPCVIEADEEQLHRLWLILLDNACKYTLPGGAITAGVEEARDGRYTVFVDDTGIGIAPEHRDRIFERFYRVDKARSRGQGGIGLGLAIAQHIAAAHGAALRLASDPGKGSRFSVTFARAAGLPARERVAEAGSIFR